MDLSIIIVNYNSRVKLLACLDCLARADFSGLKHEVIVVDNNSQDDLNNLAAQYPDAKIIISPKNLGMGGGNNLGIGAASGEYIRILNPDTIMRERSIPILFNYLKNNPDVGLIGPKLLYPDGSLQDSCARFPLFFMPLLRRTFLGRFFKGLRAEFVMNDFDHNSIRSVDWLMGSCLMFKKKLRLSDGSDFFPRFDERYFMYFEDTDLARQIWTKGFKVVYNPEAVVIHDHARASAKYPWYSAVFRDKMARVHIQSWLCLLYTSRRG